MSGYYVVSSFCIAALSVFLLVVLLQPLSCCHAAVIDLHLFLAMPWVNEWSPIVTFNGYTHSLTFY